MEDLRIDVGVHTAVTVDCSEVDFTGVQKLVLTVKNTPQAAAHALIEAELSAPGVHTVVITPEQSVLLTESAVYDVVKVLIDGRRFKMTENGKIILRYGVGDCLARD